MTRFQFIMLSSAFILITTILVTSMGLANIENPIETTPGGVDNNINFIFRMLGTFVSLLTFSIDEIPAWFNLLFTVMGVGWMYIILMIIKDVIPFT